MPIAVGGGGLGTLLLIGLFLLLGGGGISPAPQDPGQSQGQHNGTGGTGGGFDLEQCNREGAVNEIPECRAAMSADSLNRVWGEVLPDQAGLDYSMPEMELFQNDVNTACGYATARTGPFYCPRDKSIYLDTTFFKQLESMGGSDGPLSQMYVVAHEWGHHIQNIEGTLGLSDYNDPGEDSAAVALELQADCYAGVWASRADKGDDAILEPITEEQVKQAILTARAIGDDHIQEQAGQEVNPDAWTHGSSEQRQKLFLAGYESGSLAQCDTLNRGAYK